MRHGPQGETRAGARSEAAYPAGSDEGRHASRDLAAVEQSTGQPVSRSREPYSAFYRAEAAAHLLQELTVWHKARAVKINADAPQLPVRRAALTDGKLLYLAVPRLKSGQCFIELDPQRLGSRCPLVNSLRGALKYGRLVAPREMRHIDLIVCGSVAAGRDGDGSGWEGDLPTRSTLCCAMQAKCGNSRRL